MNLIITTEQANALRNVLAREIRDQHADARINGFAPPASLAPLRELFVELNRQLKGETP